ncbi:rhamnosyl/mannosyltransferase [Pseudomonas abietaniphila]|uniref:Rhamnosyl/mannosyltransferase n=2 Tax=Pseudomonas abietaniphila TaxID=89065 RepID=A0A1G8BS01_9PSED|nr:rhamnosyl/mannosyltransferase [Pseudomonas abietaniphila]
MKVLHFFKTYFPDSFGGIEQVIYQIARGAAQFGVETDVLAISKSFEGMRELDRHRAFYSKVDFESLSTPISFSAVADFRERAREVDIVHYHYPWPFMDIAHFWVRHNKPSVVTYHSDIVRQKTAQFFYRPLQRQFLSSVNRIVVTSPNYLASSNTLAEYADKTTIIPIGLDADSYPTPTEDILSKWRAIFPGRFFLFVGVLRYYKGLHTLLAAAAGAEFPIVILGAGPEEQKLKRQASELRLNNVYFLGRLPDVDKVALLLLCYATVFPSHLRSEAFGISLLESAMYRKAMICCEINTGTTYINLANQTGLVVPPESPLALRSALIKLWENPNLVDRMGLRALERFESHFTAQRMVQDYSEVYRSLI